MQLTARDFARTSSALSASASGTGRRCHNLIGAGQVAARFVGGNHPHGEVVGRPASAVRSWPAVHAVTWWSHSSSSS